MVKEQIGESARKGTAPDPDDPRKPDELSDIPKPSLAKALLRALKTFQRNQLTDQAGALTYFAVLSLFPGLLALVSLLGLVGEAEQTTQTMLDLVAQLGQASTAEQLRGPITQMTQASGAGLALVVSVLTAIWSASGYIGAFGRSMNRIYEVDEGRPFVKLKATQLILTVVAILSAAVVLLGLVVSGDVAQALGDVIGLGATSLMVWNWAKWPVMLLIVVALLAVLYHWTPNIKQPSFRWISPGALLAVLVWVVASVGFGFYVSQFGSYNKTYGSLAGVIVFLLWLWLTNNALLLGGQFNVELERARQLEAGLPAEESLQLPPRDTTASDKTAERVEEEVADMRETRIEAAVERGERPAEAQGTASAAPEEHEPRRKGLFGR